MSKEAKFNFIPETQIKKAAGVFQYTVDIAANGQLKFSKDDVRIYNLTRPLKFYADIGKKTIGWKLFDEGNLGELEGYRKLGINKWGYGVISIQKLLTAIGVDSEEHKLILKRIPVNEYKGSYLDESLSYIDLSFVNDEKLKNIHKHVKTEKTEEKS